MRARRSEAPRPAYLACTGGGPAPCAGGAGSGAEPRCSLDPGETPVQNGPTRPDIRVYAGEYALSEAAISELGLATAPEWSAELERRGEERAAERELEADTRRRALPEWSALLPPTKRGGPRERRLELCGLALPYRTADGGIAWDRRGCRDRACSVCSAARSRRVAADLRDVVALRTEQCGPAAIWFVTLTQPRRRGEEPCDAVARALATWRHLLRRERGRSVMVGGYRSLECTAVDGDGKPAGLHAHFHCLVEMAEDEEPSYLADRWVQVSSGARRHAQDVQACSDANVYQCAKYSEDHSGLADLAGVAPAYVRRVLKAIVARRTGEAWGAWRATLAQVRARKPEQGKWYADAAVRTLMFQGRDRVRWAGGGWASATQVLASLDRWPGLAACTAPRAPVNFPGSVVPAL